MRLLTWNVNSVGARLPRLPSWLAAAEPAAACLQETTCAVGESPAAELAALGLDSAVHGDGRWNGVAILGCVGPQDGRHVPGVPGFPPGALSKPRALVTCGDLSDGVPA